MTSLTKKEREYINAFYEREGDYEIKGVDKKNRHCIISVPVFDAQEDVSDPHKTLTFPVDYEVDEDGVCVFQSVNMLKPDELLYIMEYIECELGIDFDR